MAPAAVSARRGARRCLLILSTGNDCTRRHGGLKRKAHEGDFGNHLDYRRNEEASELASSISRLAESYLYVFEGLHGRQTASHLPTTSKTPTLLMTLLSGVHS